MKRAKSSKTNNGVSPLEFGNVKHKLRYSGLACKASCTKHSSTRIHAKSVGKLLSSKTGYYKSNHH